MNTPDIPSFTGDASPYAGGDPYADYRRADLPFEQLTDLADRRLGAGAIAASDEFFGMREDLLVPEAARFDPAAFGHKGKEVDGWETRRRRGSRAEAPHPTGEEHDWVLIRLGAPGVIRGVVVDTAHFRGNHPHSVSLEATVADAATSPEELTDGAHRWTEIVPRSEVGGHAANGFAVEVERRFTHLRLKQYPDGGIARLRVFGEVVPDPAWLAALRTFDVVALENGGRVEDASDRFFSSPTNTIRPGRSRKMNDGWETRRRRDRGHDWVRYALTARSEIRAVEIDTGYLKGNSAGWAALHAYDAAASAADDRSDHSAAGWREVLPRTRLQPDTVHRFVLDAPATATHARIDIFPDGGVARLRLHGSLTEAGAAELAARHRRL
ncbi:allantoicase [Streptomyces sp. TP-A0874]|uniref:allantoicase n=1 Tax=Streptomyces sp. TP-A0874 TaxID=549819 RepID=UPI000852DB8E|nr:allantoicase [Streptomyces sp. TP-A0874]